MRATSAGRINSLACSSRPGVAGGYGATPGAVAVGSGGFPGNLDLRIKIEVLAVTANGTLKLNGNGTDDATAEQAVSTGATGQEHVIRFDVVGGAGDKAALRVGSSTGGDQVLEEVELSVGHHVVAFTPAASPFYVQFINRGPATVSIDTVAMLGSGAGDAVPLSLETTYEYAVFRWFVIASWWGG